MDKEEFRVKLDQINHLVERNDYKGAMEVVDSIDWRRVKNVRTLCVVGEIYAANKRYEDSKEIFLLAYHRAPIGKNILYRLIEVSLKTGNVEEAMEYYEEYLQVAPNDSTKFLLKYKIYKENNASLEELIKILEDYKEKEFTEKWSYELARLYYQAGEEKKCLALCNEMSLWFNDGKYVMKAMDLKLKLGAMTDEEKEKFEKQFEPKLITPDQLKELNESEDETDEELTEVSEDASEDGEENNSMIGSISTKEEDVNYSESIQERISKGIRDIFNSKKREAEEAEKNAENPLDIPDFFPENTDDSIFEEVPDLEQEDGTVKESKKQEKSSVFSLKMPELKIPKKVSMEDALKVPEIPKVANVGLVDPKPAEEEEKEEVKEEFNLEDTILAAASAQGIEIPGEETPVEEEVIEDVEEELDSEMDDEELEEAEEEFLSEEDLQEAEEEFMNGPKKSEKPEGMNTGLFNFQEELKRTLAKNEFGSEAAGDFAQEEEVSVEKLEEEEELAIQKVAEELEEAAEENTDSSLDIIPREEYLNEDELKLFSYLANVPGMEEQIVDVLIDVQMAAADKTSRTGNIVVMGGKETGKTRLISALVPAICKELNLEASKVAYVFADQINGKNIPEIIHKLSSGFLVIEEANQLEKETVVQLDKAMEFRTDGLTVILEDEKIGMRKFLARYPKFAKKFTSQISIPIFTNDELVSFADVYTKENGYSMDQEGLNALYNMIGKNQKEDEPMSIGVVKEILDSAIARSQAGIRKFKRKRTGEDGLMILTEKDFNI